MEWDVTNGHFIKKGRKNPLLHGAPLTPGRQHPTLCGPRRWTAASSIFYRKTPQLLVRSSYYPLLLVGTIWSSFSREQIWPEDKDFKQEIHRTNELLVKILRLWQYIHSLSDLLRIIRLKRDLANSLSVFTDSISREGSKRLLDSHNNVVRPSISRSYSLPNTRLPRQLVLVMVRNSSGCQFSIKARQY